MDDKTEELIALIAKKHGIALDETDPIMVVPTLLRYLLDESQEKQGEILDEFKSELQSALMQWDYSAKDKADRILNAALKANTEVMERVLTSTATETAAIIRKEVQDEIRKSRSHIEGARKLAMMNMASAVITLMAAAVAFVATFY
ncbi:conjugal transfer protein TraM [Escherichia coli]|uniref:conjugal transfer protein TraM n=1 Tax=Escherichia coli TaxID=562 RepID=UPI000BDF4EF5|nr:conjugal transfer protein TraM [Escherichia coli]EFD4482057.1 conjugal transfer protein TraM [Escherichia coli]EFD4732449.1 conjugal transfer protein TraM [Escherichia coli]EHY2864314.1 conjugal transfer protein TraM [Escherichia coli]EJN6795132.1 conjugal transfer protein TraM [Escherichia coli]EJX6274561.1 conjugal transfer protein TraM [Escherichia coli]